MAINDSATDEVAAERNERRYGLDGAEVPRWLRHWGAYAWRIIAIGIVVVFTARLMARLEVLLVPIITALFLSTLLIPVATRLRRVGVPALIATWGSILLAVAIIVGVVYAIYPSTRNEFSALNSQLTNGVSHVQHWLQTGPLHLSASGLTHAKSQLGADLGKYRDVLIAGAVAGISTVLDVLAGILLTIVLTFFFVKDGRKITSWFIDLWPQHHRSELSELSERLWKVLSGYIHGTAINGAVNAAVMSIGLIIIGVPLVIPIAILTFVGGFLPIVGAILSGAVAALVALAVKGPLAAGAVILLTLLVHHLEGYIVGPLVLGRAVRLHPVAILLALGAGSLIGGIVGAFVAVPLTAVIAETVAFYRSRRIVDLTTE